MTVLIDQDHVQDFLVELENSPMSIQVKDFELSTPSSRVTKPEKGEGEGFGGMMGGGMMGMMTGMHGEWAAWSAWVAWRGQMEQQMHGMMASQRG